MVATSSSGIAYFLLTYPNPNLRNYSNPRRNGAKPSGVVVLHTGENATDMTGVDSGAENVARYLSTRTTYGSYHRLVDSDSTVPVLPWEYEAYHCIYTNNHSVGISAAIQKRHWDVMPKDRRDAILRRMAECAADYARWLVRERGIEIPARWLTREEALAGKPGFIEHGRTDPWRRSDPWDRDSDEAADFMRYYIAALGGGGGGTSPVVVPTIPKPTPVEGEWPDVDLWVDGMLGPVTIRAWQRLMASIGKYEGLIDGVFGPVTARAMQSWLRGLGRYHGWLDGQFGPLSVKALQWFLVGKSLYTGAVDGLRGPLTVKAEQEYLNDQRKYQ